MLNSPVAFTGCGGELKSQCMWFNGILIAVLKRLTANVTLMCGYILFCTVTVSVCISVALHAAHIIKTSGRVIS